MVLLKNTMVWYFRMEEGRIISWALGLYLLAQVFIQVGR